MLIVPSPAVLPAWSRWNILRRDARLQLQLVAAPYDPWVGWGGVDCASGKLSARAREQARKRANEQTSKRARRGAQPGQEGVHQAPALPHDSIGPTADPEKKTKRETRTVFRAPPRRERPPRSGDVRASRGILACRARRELPRPTPLTSLSSPCRSCL
jgi:hypothetical protein